MSNERKIRHGFRLRVARDTEPTIFFWPVIPESILAVHALESGGANVTVNLPNGGTITQAVLESKEEIEDRIAKCQELDAQCQGEDGTAS